MTASDETFKAEGLGYLKENKEVGTSAKAGENF